MANKAKQETATMKLASELLQRGTDQVNTEALRRLYPEAFADRRVVTHRSGKNLKRFLEDGRNAKIRLDDETEVLASWDDVVYDIRTLTGLRTSRETVRTWAKRYGIQEPEHDYGVNADDMPDGGEGGSAA